MKTLMLAATVGAIACSGPAYAGEWRIVDASDRNMVAVDEASIKSEASRRTYWAAIVDAQADADGGRYSLVRFVIDCDREIIRIVSVIRYSEGGGLPVNRLDAPFNEEQIVPDTMGDQMREAVCDDVWLTSYGVPEVADFVNLATLAMARAAD